MKIPQERLLQHSVKIAEILSKRFKFGIYDEEDIKQEVHILILQSADKYDPSKGEEFAFFYHYAKNRLITLKRDNFCDPKLGERSKDVLKVRSPEEIKENSKSYINTELEEIDRADLLSSLVDSKIPANLRLNYLKMLEGMDVGWHERIKIHNTIKTILWINNEEEEI